MPGTGTYIAGQVLPPAEVSTQAGQIEVVTRKSLLTIPATRRTALGGYNRINVNLDKMDYVCVDSGLEHPIARGRRETVQYNRQLGAARHLKHKMLLAREIDVLAPVFDTSVYNVGAGTATAASAAWDTSESTPIADVGVAKTAIRLTTGLVPNALILNGAMLEILLANPQIIGRFPGAPLVTEDMIRANVAAIFGLQKLIVSNGVYDSAPEGATQTLVDVIPDGLAQVAVVANESDPLEMPALGRDLYWAEDGAREDIYEEYYEDAVRAEIHRVRNNRAPKIFDPLFAHMLTGIQTEES
jgi:hypothetical protein